MAFVMIEDATVIQRILHPLGVATAIPEPPARAGAAASAGHRPRRVTDAWEFPDSDGRLCWLALPAGTGEVCSAAGSPLSPHNRRRKLAALDMHAAGPIMRRC